MSLTTWKKEFYPTDASSIKTMKGAIKHSLRKWKGLTKENLKKHGVVIFNKGVVISIEDSKKIYYVNGLVGDLSHAFYLDERACSLCWIIHYNFFNCQKCPITKAGFASCHKDYSAYGEFEKTGNPKPMIKVLEKTLKYWEKK